MAVLTVEYLHKGVWIKAAETSSAIVAQAALSRLNKQYQTRLSRDGKRILTPPNQPQGETYV